MIAAFFLTQLRHWLRPADLRPKPVSTPFKVLVCADGEVAGVQEFVPEAALTEVEVARTSSKRREQITRVHLARATLSL